MTFDEFVEQMRQEVREEGFMSGINLEARIVVRAKERDVICHPVEIINVICCDDIHRVWYTNTVSSIYKELYYYR